MPSPFRIRIAVLLFCLLTIFGHAEVTVEPEQIEAGLIFWANNPDPWPVTGTVTGVSVNTRSDVEFPRTLVLRPSSRTKVATFHQANPRQAYRANVIVRSRAGNLNARPKPRTRYRFPFQSGESYKVSQGFHGEISHTGQYEYAVDFMTPIGTVVCAAREGIVVKIENDFERGAWDPALELKANVIEILHGDGTVATYAHLQYHGATVQLGQRVNEGDPIGHSGRTGMIRAAHLHFHVAIPTTGDEFRSVPIKFKSKGRGGIEPEKDQTYTAE